MKNIKYITASLLLSLFLVGCGGSSSSSSPASSSASSSSSSSSGSSNQSSASGTLDLSFANLGYILHDNAAGGGEDDAGNAMALDSNGNIYIAGTSKNNSDNYDMVIWKYKSDGTLDTSFSGDGIVVHNSAAGGNSYDGGNSIALDNNGNIYVCGYSYNTSFNTDLIIWKYKSDGTLDTSFNSNGIIVYSNIAGGDRDEYGNDIVLDSSGNIYITGYSRNDLGRDSMIILKYKSDGSLDTSFDSDGVVIHNNAAGGNGHNRAYALVLDSKNNIYVTGDSFNASSDYDMVIWKYKNDGTLDTSFSNDGIVVHNNAAGGNKNDKGLPIALDSDENIYVAGTSYNGSHDSMVIWKYKSDGTLDTSFSNDGIVTFKSNNGSANGYDIALQDKSIYVTGGIYNGSNKDMAIWKYKSDGNLDTSFDSDGLVKFDGSANSNSQDEGNRIALNKDNKIYIAGTISNANNIYTDMAIWRYK